VTLFSQNSNLYHHDTSTHFHLCLQVFTARSFTRFALLLHASCIAVMMVQIVIRHGAIVDNIVIGVYAKFDSVVLVPGLGLGLEVWPWSKIQGQNLGTLQNSPLTSIDWSTVTGVNYISRSTFLTYLQWVIMAL